MHNSFLRFPVKLHVEIRGASLALLLGALLGTNGQLRAAPTADGLFATFDIKRGAVSIGEFSCKLEFEKVPRTVANFVGLAVGSAAWIDFRAGHATRRPFFDGLTFQPMIAGQVVQSGAPSIDGSDGRPGYTLPDEFDPTLRHDQAGILSMEKSGLHLMGSRFFITVAAASVFDNVHSAFGEVVDGMSVFTSIQPGDKIESVTIVRNGPSAQAFNAAQHGVPTVLDAKPVLEKLSPGYRLSYSKPANSETLVFHSDTLADWVLHPGEDQEGTASLTAIRDVSSVTAGKAMQFFNVARVQYPESALAPANVIGKKIYLMEPGFGGVHGLTFSSSTSANYFNIFPGNGIGFTSYTWTREVNRCLFIGLSNGATRGITRVEIIFDFTSATAGYAKGDFLVDTGVLHGTDCPFEMTNL